MVLLLVQVHKVIQGIALNTHYLMLHGADGISGGGLKLVGRNSGIPLVDFAEGLSALSRSTTLVPYL